jgi:hypothetical protein
MKLKGEECILYWGLLVGFALMAIGVGMLAYSLFARERHF